MGSESMHAEGGEYLATLHTGLEHLWLSVSAGTLRISPPQIPRAGVPVSRTDPGVPVEFSELRAP